MIKLVAVDLDGTFLSPDRTISKANIEAARRIQKEGVRFVVNSGRDYEGITHVVKAAGLTCDYITMNGAAIYTGDGSLLQACYMKSEDVEFIFSTICAEEFYIDISTSRGTFNLVKEEEAEKHIREKTMIYRTEAGEDQDKAQIEQDIAEFMSRSSCVESVDEIYAKGIQICKISLTHKDTGKILKTRELLSRNKNLAVAASFVTNIEITDKNAQKGIALMAYAKEYGIKPEEVMAFGDSLNDESMLGEDFGYTVAMGNADEGIKRMAKYITRTNAQDGVAYFINEMI